MLLVPIPWATRVWALPFLTALAPSERYYEGKARGHKKLTDWARQMLLQVRRWLPERALVVVADSSFAAILLLECLRRLPNPICIVTRLRLDAALYKPAPTRKPGKSGRPRLKGARLPTLEHILGDKKTVWKKVAIRDWYGQKRRQIEIVSRTAVWYHSGMPPLPIRWVLIRDPKGKFRSQALLCTDLNIDPIQIVKWFVMRWQLEVTFQEVRTHLGVETQRQWSDWAIARTTPALLGLFSLVTLLAHCSTRQGKLPIRQAAWYAKPLPTFFFGCVGCRSIPVVASDEFSYVSIRHRHAKSAARCAEAFHRCLVLCGSTVISTRLYNKSPILGLDLTIQAELMLCLGIPDRWPLDKVQLRACSRITPHFPAQAEVSLSPSKSDFCGSGPENPLEIALRQAQGDFSLAAKMRSCF